MTIPLNTVPDKETILDACKMLKDRHAQSNEVGREIADRLSAEAEAAGLTTTSPLHKKSKIEIEASLAKEIFAPGAADEGPPAIAQGRPCLTGVPADD